MKLNSFQGLKVLKDKPSRFTLLVIASDKKNVDEILVRGEFKDFDIEMHENFQDSKEYMENSGQDDRIQGVLLDLPLKLTADDKIENIKDIKNIFKVQRYFIEKYKHLPMAVHGLPEKCKEVQESLGDEAFSVNEDLDGVFNYFRSELENKEKGIKTKYEIAFKIVSQSHFPKNTKTDLLKLLLEIDEVREQDKDINFVSIGGKTRKIVDDVIKALHEIDQEMVLSSCVDKEISFIRAMECLSNRDKDSSKVTFVDHRSYIRNLFNFLYWGSSNIVSHSYPKGYYWTTCHTPTYYTVLAWQNGILDLLMWVKYISGGKPAANA